MFAENKIFSAVAYCRVSSDHQTEKETIQNQINFVNDYCKLNKITLQHIYKDDGITGTLPLGERPEGARLLADAKQGKFNLVLVYKLDRLGRATRIILNAIHDLDEYGVKIKSMTEPFDTADASGRFLVTILAGVADLERNNILQRMELGSTRAAKAGKYLGGIPPYGYRVNEKGFFEPNNKPIPNINMSEVEIIQKIYSLCLEGLSTVNIAEKLNNLGIPSLYQIRDMGKRKNPNARWRATTVYRMLKSTTYKGIHCYGKNRKQTIKREVPALIDIDTWDKVQAKLKSNNTNIKGNVKHQYLLRGLMKCEHCGYGYSGAFTGNYVYYVDIGRHSWRAHGRKEPCFGKTINRDWIESTVWESCLQYIRNPQLVVKSVEKQISQTESLEQEIALIHARIDENGLARQRLIDLYKNGLIDLQSVSSEFEKVDKEKDSLVIELEQLKSQQHKNDLLSQVDTATNLLDLLREKVDRPDVPFETKRAVVETMVDRITVNSSDKNNVKITIYFRFGDKKPTNYTPTKKHNTLSRASSCDNILEISMTVYTKSPYRGEGKGF